MYEEAAKDASLDVKCNAQLMEADREQIIVKNEAKAAGVERKRYFCHDTDL